MVSILLRLSLAVLLAAGPLVWPCCCAQAKAATDAGTSDLPPCCQARLAKVAAERAMPCHQQKTPPKDSKPTPCSPIDCQCHDKIEQGIIDHPLIDPSASAFVFVEFVADHLTYEPLRLAAWQPVQIASTGNQRCAELCVWRI